MNFLDIDTIIFSRTALLLKSMNNFITDQSYKMNNFISLFINVKRLLSNLHCIRCYNNKYDLIWIDLNKKPYCFGMTSVHSTSPFFFSSPSVFLLSLLLQLFLHRFYLGLQGGDTEAMFSLHCPLHLTETSFQVFILPLQSLSCALALLCQRPLSR